MDLSYSEIKRLFDRPQNSKHSSKDRLGDLTITDPDELIEQQNMNYKSNQSMTRSMSKLKPTAAATPYVSNKTIEVLNQQSPMQKEQDIFVDRSIEASPVARMSTTHA